MRIKVWIGCSAALVAVLIVAASGSRAAGAGSAPDVQTGAANSVTSSSVVLNGSVVPGGALTTCSFAYGPTTSYGSLTKARTVGSGTSSVAVTAPINGLAATTAFHYQLVCSNAVGTASGNDRTFTTLEHGTSGRVAIAGRRLFISPAGLVGVFVACFGDHPCSGTVSLTAGNTALAPAANYTIVNQTETVVFTTLTKTALKQLQSHGILSATATATAVDVDGSRSSIPFTLYQELL
jgi:hypothetical protein